MHELSLVTEVYRAARRTIDARGGGRLQRVDLAVGELAAVEPDLLRFAWQAVTEGGPDQGATIEVEWRPARQVCEGCGDIPERATGSWLRLCPRCERPLRVEGGDDLDILRLAYDPAGAEGDTA
jgi:hydrogenase nickel incorporation protein HypA/HybF